MAFLYFINQRQYYGRQGIDMETNCRGMLHLYEQAVKGNMEMADSHRKLAAEIK